VLDVGTGPGGLLAAFHRERAGLALVGIDISESMVERARRNLARAGIAAAVDVRVGDAARLPFEGGRSSTSSPTRRRTFCARARVGSAGCAR
jgi:ubiquinone/menaquinone biosynthesis C-methylase UbiE